MSSLQQLQMTYDQLQDRLVLTIYTQDWCEYQFWITRRATQILWQVLSQLLQQTHKTEKQTQQENQEVQKKIEQETGRRQALAEQYSNKLTRRPLGDVPLLVYKIMVRPNEQGFIFIHLEDNQGRAVEFGGDTKILVALSQLIQRLSQQADWKLSF